MRIQLLQTFTAMALGALTLGSLGCDVETSDDDTLVSARELASEANDARAEAEALALEAAEAEVDFSLHACGYAETPELVDACALREEDPASGIDDLVASAPSSANPWSCLESNACGGQTEYCFCDWACWWFGDCCWDYAACP